MAIIHPGDLQDKEKIKREILIGRIEGWINEMLLHLVYPLRLGFLAWVPTEVCNEVLARLQQANYDAIFEATMAGTGTHRAIRVRKLDTIVQPKVLDESKNPALEDQPVQSTILDQSVLLAEQTDQE